MKKVEKANRKERRDYITIVLLLLGVIFLWWLSWHWIDSNITKIKLNLKTDVNISDQELQGAFGDKFGAINALFSAFAFAGIIFTIILQRKELKLQREELSDTREEFIKQNFRTTFFNLLKTQRQLAEEINCNVNQLYNMDNIATENFQGRLFFIKAKSEMKRISRMLERNTYTKYYRWDTSDDIDYNNSLPHEQDEIPDIRQAAYTSYYYKINQDQFESYKKLSGIEKAERLYSFFFNKYSYVIGHYFRHLYHILKFLKKHEESTFDEKGKKENVRDFADFIQAQMSIPEMFLLYYNCLKFPKLKQLIIDYNLLENLPSQMLISLEHTTKDIKLKTSEPL